MNIPHEIRLNPAQQRVIDHGVLDSGFSTVLQMPTGSGKTWLAREAIRSSLNHGFRAVYLSPLRALADELSTSWTSVFPGTPVGVFMPVDPYRLRRALDLNVKGDGKNQWSVTGGSEPRLVQLTEHAFSCSCPDHAKGRECKHLIAVRLHRKDPEICRLVLLSKFGTKPTVSYLDLFQLWFDQ